MVVVRYPDAEAALSGVGLVTELWKRQPPRALAREGAGWVLALPELPVDRLPYQLQLTAPDGTTRRVPDPAARPTRTVPPGWSELRTRAYRDPAWLGVSARPGRIVRLRLRSERLGGELVAPLWCAPGLPSDAVAPLLLVHDGPAYLREACLGAFLAAGVATGALPPLRALLLASRDRMTDYAASPAYADALADDLLPALRRLSPHPDAARIGLGASLGALALLHAQWHRPGLFSALALQSGSFFGPELDHVEAGFSGFRRITQWVAYVRDTARTGPPPLPVAIGCGTGEENLANNRLMAEALQARSFPLTWHPFRDGHNWTGWRDNLAAVLCALGLS
jgi:enterochelin esterase family protein